MFGKAPAGSDDGAAGASEIVTISAGDAFNDAEVAQAGELSGGWRESVRQAVAGGRRDDGRRC